MLRAMPLPDIAVVIDGGSPQGRAIALALAARGTRVVVAGVNERDLGETVGEIVYGGGKARHVVGDVEAATPRAREVFGGLDVIVRVGADGVSLLRDAHTANGLCTSSDPEETARAVIAYFDAES
jgi:NAD(P)-dependent dehydrogenase (short-subunit alcohol dehydrogenase family)